MRIPGTTFSDLSDEDYPVPKKKNKKKSYKLEVKKFEGWEDGPFWVVHFTVGVQSFQISSDFETEKDAKWMKKMFQKAIDTAFGD